MAERVFVPISGIGRNAEEGLSHASSGVSKWLRIAMRVFAPTPGIEARAWRWMCGFMCLCFENIVACCFVLSEGVCFSI
jgi:hypothetical protein